MLKCEKCQKEFYTPKPVGLALFEGECLNCLSPEKRERLRRILFNHAGVIEVDRQPNEPAATVEPAA